MSSTLKELPEHERPRERLQLKGLDGVSTCELIAIILSSGTKGKSAVQLAYEVYAFFGSLEKLAAASVEELCQIKGLGPVKAVKLKAAFGLGRKAGQLFDPIKYRIKTSLEAYELVKEDLRGALQERFLAILQDTKGCVIKTELISIGTLDMTLVHPRELFFSAIRHKAATLIVVHNHPSGDPTPSSQDIALTRRLIECGKMMGIPLQDHLVIGCDSYVSIKESGLVGF